MSKGKSEEKETDTFLNNLHETFDIKRQMRGDHGSISTGILSLDLATSKGGMPRGLLVDLYGDEGLGKTTMSLAMIAERIRNGERCAFIDVEHRLMPELKDTMVPDGKRLEVFQPATGEQTFGIVERLLQYPEFTIIVLDSIAALVFKEEMELDKYTAPIALLARKVGAFSRKILGPIYKYGALVIFINQMRSSPTGYGPVLKISTGGKAIRFLSSLRLKMSGDELIKKGDEIVGQKVKIRVDKNSFGAPHRDTRVSIMYGQGVDRVRDLIDCGLETGDIVQTGGYYKFKQIDMKGKVVREIQAHGESALAEKLAPHLDEIRRYMQKAIAERCKRMPSSETPLNSKED